MASQFFTKSTELFAPAWFRRPYMRTLLRSFGGVLDDYVDIVYAGRRSAIPYAAGARGADGTLLECEPAVLTRHARDRGINLYNTEPTLSRRVRISQWHQLKRSRGSHQGEMRNVQPFWLFTAQSPLPTIRIVHQSNHPTPVATWHTLNSEGVYSVRRAEPSNWNYDNQPTKRARFWVIFYLPVGFATGNAYYDDGTSAFDDGVAVYDGLRGLAIADIVGAIREAKAAHSLCAGVISTQLQPDEPFPDGGGALPFDPDSTAITLPDGSTSLPTGNWGAAVDPVTNLPTRPLWASFLYENNP